MESYDYLDLFTSTLKDKDTKHCDQKQSNTAVTLIVGGKLFETCKDTMDAIPDSLLSQMSEKSPHYNDTRKAYIFDRDPISFNEILETHRNGELHTPRGVCPARFNKELEFWRIPVSLMLPCCWKYFYENLNDLEVLDNILKNRSQPAALKKVDLDKSARGNVIKVAPWSDRNKNNWVEPETSLRQKLWLLMEEPATSTAAKIWCFFYISMVILSVLLFFLWLEPDLRVDSYLSELEMTPIIKAFLLRHNRKVFSIALEDAHPVVFVLDCICIAFFIVEAIVLLIVCPNKLRLLKSPYFILKIIVCLAMVGSFIFDVNKNLIENMDIGKFYVYLKGFSTLRLLFIFRVQKLYGRLRIVLLSLQQSIKELALLVFVFLVTIIIYGGMMYCGELDTDNFPNIRTSCWWALITMTTIGYGDFYPTGTLGYIIAGICAIQGLVVISLPIAAIASVFSTYYCRNSDLETHEAFIKSQREKFTKSNDAMEKDNNYNKLKTLTQSDI